MSAAGLNPMLAYMKGGGASTPAGSQANVIAPQYTSPITGAAHYKLTSAQTAKTLQEVPKTSAETNKIQHETANISAHTELIGNTITKTKNEIGKLELEQKTLSGGLTTQDLEQKRLRVVIDNVAQETVNLKQKNASEIQTTLVLKETVAQMHNKSLISDMELKAILDTDMLGVYAREIKSVTDIGGDFLSGIVDRVMSRLPRIPQTIIHKK